MSWIKKKIISGTIILFSCLVALVIVEMVLRVFDGGSWAVTRQANILRNFQHSYRIDNLYQSDKIFNHYKRDNYGLRGEYSNLEDIDVLCIGGSTTDQRYVTLESTFQSILETNLKKVDPNFGFIVNAGVDGHSTWGHLFSFEKWFPLIPNLRPKYVLLYVGVNDAPFEQIYNPRFRKRQSGVKGFLKQLELVNALMPLFNFLKTKIPTSAVDFASHNKRVYSDADYSVTSLHEDTARLSKENALAFKARMVQILDYIQELGAIPVCVTQPHRYTVLKNGKRYGIPNVFGEGFSGVDFDYSLNEINLVLRQLFGENILDLNSYPFNNEDFYDGVHTTASGSQNVGEAMSTYFISRFYSDVNDLN